MSHFSRIRTQMAEKQYIIQALEDLGYPYEDKGDATVNGWQGRTTNAEITVATPDKHYNIGFVKNGETYELVADWYEMRNFNRNDFVNKLTQRYAYHTTRAKLEEQGFSLVNEESEKDGRIHLVVRRMV